MVTAPRPAPVATEFEETLQLAFQNQLLFTVTGQKPFVMIYDFGELPIRDFYTRLEVFRQLLRPGPANVEWFLSQGPLVPERNRNSDWIFFYNRKAIERLLQNPEARENFNRAGVNFQTAQDAIDFMTKRFSDRVKMGRNLSLRDELVMGTLLGYPPSDVVAFSNRAANGRIIQLAIEDRDKIPYLIATHKTYLPSDSPVFERLRVQAQAAMIWFTGQRQAGRSLLSILLGI